MFSRFCIFYLLFFNLFTVFSQQNNFILFSQLEKMISNGDCEKVLSVMDSYKIPEDDLLQKAKFYYYKATALNQCEDYKAAEKILQNLLKNHKNLLIKNRKLLGKTYFELAYSASGNYNQKYEIYYTQKALEVMEKSPHLFEKAEIISTYNDLFYYQNNYNDHNGLDRTERKFREMVKKIPATDKNFPHARRVFRKMQIIIALMNKKPDEAIAMLNIFLKETASATEEDQNYINSCYSEIAGFYYNEQDFLKCINASERSASYALKTNYPHYRMIAFSKIAASYLKLGKYEKALMYINSSLDLIKQKKDFNSSIYSLNTMKALAFAGLGEYQKAAILVEKNITEIILKKTGKQTRIEDLDFREFNDLNSNYFINIFATSGHIFLNKYKKEYNKSDLQKAENLFLISSEMFQEFYLKGEFNPLLHSLHTKIAEGLLNIAFEKYPNNQGKTTEIIGLIERNSSKHLYKEFIRKRNIPDDGSASFRILTEDKYGIQNIVNNLENDHQILKFYVGTEDIFQVLIGNEKIELLKLGKTNAIKKLTADFIGKIKTPLEFPKNSEALKKILLPKISAKKIILISDDFLNYLPFESLQKNGKYLSENFDLSYHYSLALWQMKYSERRKTYSKISVFTPFYQAGSSFNGFETPSLKFSKKEAQEILTRYSGKLFSGKDANKTNFYKQAKTSNILHLSMHSILDENNFRRSCLLFQDNVPLYFEELYNENIPAEMVVLGACNTGNGYLKNGEGIMSISHAFMFAGSKSNVFSLWEIPDRETSELMGYFYKFLKKGQQKDEALANAKREFIKNNPLKVHPYFWAGFIVNGNTDPISGNGYQWVLWAFSGIVFIVLLGLMVNRKIRKT